MQETRDTKPLRQSFVLFRASLRLCCHQPHWIAYPSLGLVAAVALAWVLPQAYTESPTIAAASLGPPALGVLSQLYPGAMNHLGVLALVASIFVTLAVLFFEAALAHAVLKRLDGQRMGMRTAMAVARRCVPSLIGFSSFSVAVGHLFFLLADRHAGVAAVALHVAWQVWTLATFLIVPVIVAEDEPSGTSLRRSALLFANNWKPVLFADALVHLVAAAMIFLLWLGLRQASAPLLDLPVAATALLAVACVAALSLLRTVHTCVVYRWITAGTAPAPRDHVTGPDT
ncbi:MAG: DUF6159 family protein [Nannocystaceae bacterium]